MPTFRHRSAACVAGLLAAAALTSAASAQVFVYNTWMRGAFEAPPTTSPAVGFATVTVNTIANTMRVEAQWSGLVGNTTVAHIHAATAAPFAGTAGVATTTPSFAGFPAGVTAGSFDQTYDMTLASSFNATYVTANGGTAAAWSALQSALASGRAYLNIHSSTFTGGEIRGFLPTPGAAGLLAVAGVVGMRRRRSA